MSSCKFFHVHVFHLVYIRISSIPASSRPYGTPEINPIFISQSNCACPGKRPSVETTTSNAATSSGESNVENPKNNNASSSRSTSCPRTNTTRLIPPSSYHYKYTILHIWFSLALFLGFFAVIMKLQLIDNWHYIYLVDLLQGENSELYAHRSDWSSCIASYSILLPNANLHDIQCLAMRGCCGWSRSRILLFWVRYINELIQQSVFNGHPQSL